MDHVARIVEIIFAYKNVLEKRVEGRGLSEELGIYERRKKI